MSNKYLNLTGLQKFKEKISVIATQEKDGFMSSTDKTKLDGIATGANKYTHPTTSGNKHIPSGGSTGQILRWSEDGTAIWDNENSITGSYLPLAGGKLTGVVKFGSDDYYINSLGNAILNSLKTNTNSGIDTTENNFRTLYIRTGLRYGQFAIDSTGSLGIYDATNSKWLIKSDTSQDVSIRGNKINLETITEIKNSGWGKQLILTRTDSAANASIRFDNYNTDTQETQALGFLALGTVDGSFLRYNSSASENYKILDEENYKSIVTPANIGAATSGHTHSYLPLSGGSLTGNVKITSSSATQVEYGLKNSLREVKFVNNKTGRAGIYDSTNSEWLFYSDTDGAVNVPVATNFTGQVIFDYMMRTKGGYSLLYNGNYVQAFYVSTNTIKPSSIDQQQVVIGAAASNTGLATVIRGSTIWFNSDFLYQKSTMVYYTSDARLKTDEGYLDNSNEKTSKYILLWEKMIPRAYRMKEDVENIGDEAKYQLGYYAQEFQESLHDCNLTEKDFAGLSIVKDYVDDSEDQDDTEFLDNRYFLSYDQCSMLTDIKLRQVVNEVLPAMQTTIDSLKAQVEELTNIISEMKGE